MITKYRKLVPLSYSGLFMASITKHNGIIKRHDIKNYGDLGVCYFDFRMTKKNLIKHNAYINEQLIERNVTRKKLSRDAISIIELCIAVLVYVLAMYVFSIY